MKKRVKNKKKKAPGAWRLKTVCLVKSDNPEDVFLEAREFYDEREANRYAFSRAMQRAQRGLTLRALELALFPFDAVLLDAGCGNGFSMQVLKEVGYSRAKGVDASPAMVAQARARGFDAVEGDLRSLPFSNACFDGIISVSALQWLKDGDVSRAAREFHRVLREGGRAVAQFYPKSEGEMMAFARAFNEAGFTVRVIVDNPRNARKRRVFLLLDKL